MKAIVIDGFGGAERLRLTDVPTPEPADDEVLIRVACAGVNPVDWKIREGMLAGLFPHGFPLIPGWDAAGSIAGHGANVRDFSLGDRVYAYCRKPEVRWGAYAQFLTLPAAAVAPMPASLGFAEAAAIPLAALTAWQSLFDAAALKAGETVLIHAGAGGVGGYAIQLAKHAGATVITTAGAANGGYVRGLGADHMIDYGAEDFVAAVRRLLPEGADVVYATVGGDVLERSYRCLRPGGRLVSIVDPPMPEEAERVGASDAFVFVASNGEQLRQIAALIDQGRLKVPAITTLPLEEAAQAQRLSQAGHVRGKIVLTIEP